MSGEISEILCGPCLCAGAYIRPLSGSGESRHTLSRPHRSSLWPMSTLFECASCGLQAPYDYFGKAPPYGTKMAYVSLCLCTVSIFLLIHSTTLICVHTCIYPFIYESARVLQSDSLPSIWIRDTLFDEILIVSDLIICDVTKIRWCACKIKKVWPYIKWMIFWKISSMYDMTCCFLSG